MVNEQIRVEKIIGTVKMCRYLWSNRNLSRINMIVCRIKLFARRHLWPFARDYHLLAS